jgi:hypothetical protein
MTLLVFETFPIGIIKCPFSYVGDWNLSMPTRIIGPDCKCVPNIQTNLVTSKRIRSSQITVADKSHMNDHKEWMQGFNDPNSSETVGNLSASLQDKNNT